MRRADIKPLAAALLRAREEKENKLTVAEQALQICSEDKTRLQCLNECMSEHKAKVTQLRWNTTSDGVYENVVLELPDGVLKHNTWISRKDSMTTVSVKIS